MRNDSHLAAPRNASVNWRLLRSLACTRHARRHLVVLFCCRPAMLILRAKSRVSQQVKELTLPAARSTANLSAEEGLSSLLLFSHRHYYCSKWSVRYHSHGILVSALVIVCSLSFALARMLRMQSKWSSQRCWASVSTSEPTLLIRRQEAWIVLAQRPILL